MADVLDETIETYERTAEAMADYFRSVSKVRSTDVDRAFELRGEVTKPFVFEIGCADGRDASYILQKADRYTGIDPANKFIEMAKKNVPAGNFEVGDARTYEYPKDIDIVFGFASLLHLSKEECRDVFEKLSRSLKPGGVIYLSLKKGKKYESYIKEDKYGKRLFYLYNPEVIKTLANPWYETVYTKDDGFVTTDNTEWFDVALRKN